MNRHAPLHNLCRQRPWPVCSLFLLFFFITSCHKPGPTQPTPEPDTTSHNFTWQITALGDGLSSSILNDVAIINDTLVYAVGAIYLKDSTGQEDSSPFNTTVWNGKSWMITRATVDFGGSMINNIPLNGVIAFSPTDIWLVGSLPIHGDGKNWTIFDIRTITQSSVSVEKAWGTDSKNMYFVGLGGSAVHYDGSNWQVLESGTTLPIQDIWGATNPSTRSTEIVAVASNPLESPMGKKLLFLQGTNVIALPDSGLSLRLSGVWFSPGSSYFIVGDGIYSKTHISTSDPWISVGQGLPLFYGESIRGNAENDIVIAGDFGLVAHFNGQTWRNFQNQVPPSNTLFHAAAIRGNMIVAVGENGANAVVQIGRRE